VVKQAGIPAVPAGGLAGIGIFVAVVRPGYAEISQIDNPTRSEIVLNSDIAVAFWCSHSGKGMQGFGQTGAYQSHQNYRD